MIRQQQKKLELSKNSFAWSCLVLLLVCLFSLQLQGAELVVFNLAATTTQDQIQTALDGLTGGGEVVLAAGTYEIDRPIILRHDNQTLRGSGSDTILHLANKANCPVIILGAPMATPQRPTAHLRLAGLTINGNRQNQQMEFWKSAMDGSQLNNNGIDIWDVNDSSVEEVVCRSCRSGGLVTAVTRRLNVHDFTAYDNQYDGLACYTTEESRFSGLHLHDNLAAGISLDLAFNKNTIADAVLTGNDLGVFMRNSRDNSFQGVTISNSRNHGIFMAQTGGLLGGTWRPEPGTECTGNKFDGLMITNCGGDAFLVNDSSCKDNTIRDAHFLDNSAGGLTESGDDLVRVEQLVQR